MDPFDELNLSPMKEDSPFDMEYMKREWSEEAYFGENNVFKNEVLSHIKILRELFNNAKKEDLSFADKPLNDKHGIGKEINERIILLQKTIERNINVEKCFIGLQPNFNAFTLSVAWDSARIAKTNKNGTLDKEGTFDRTNLQNENMVKTLEDIVESKNGYKFKTSKNKTILLSLGVDLFFNDKANLSDEAIGAVLFHEIGHNFQQMVSNINNVLIDTTIRQALVSGVRVMKMDPFLVFGLINSIMVHMEIGGYNKAESDSETQKRLSAALLKGSIYVDKKDGTLYGRDKEGEALVENNLKAVMISSKMSRIKMNVMLNILKWIFYTITGIIRVIAVPFALGQALVSYAAIISPNKKIIEKNKRSEQFADMFPIAYGFGANSSSEFSIALKTMGYSNGSGFKEAKFLNFVPILGTMVAYDKYLRTHMMELASGYDSNRKRIVNDYKVLQYELKNNKDLSAESIAEIERQMDDIEQSYEKFTKIGGSEYMFYNIFVKTFHGDIKKEKSSVEENVLDVLYDMKNSPVPGDSKAMDKSAAKANKIPINTLQKYFLDLKKSSKAMFGK